MFTSAAVDAAALSTTSIAQIPFGRQVFTGILTAGRTTSAVGGMVAYEVGGGRSASWVVTNIRTGYGKGLRAVAPGAKRRGRRRHCCAAVFTGSVDLIG